MAVKEINESGGVLGEQVEAGSILHRIGRCSSEKAKQLINDEKVAVTFGCWTSVSRKIPAFLHLRRRTPCCSILYNTVWEEQSLNAFYTAASPEPTIGSCKSSTWPMKWDARSFTFWERITFSAPQIQLKAYLKAPLMFLMKT